MKRALMVFLTIVAAPAAAQDGQFNLNCTGIETVSAVGKEEAKPYDAVYRIDLAAGKWCESECKAIHEIASVQPTQITLQDDERDTPTESSFLSNYINRETGEHRIATGSRNARQPLLTLSITWRGQCERAPFGGFPEFKTKF